MLRKTLIATALLAAMGAASATTYSWGSHDSTAESNLTYVSVFAFNDVYTFSLGTAEVASSSVVSLNLSPVYAISNGSYSLVMDNGATGPDVGDTLLGTWSFSGSTGSTSHSVSLAVGNYYYIVSGLATGAGDGAHNAGIYSIASTISPSVITVPEPESYALMLAGLGVVGFLAGRRRSA